MRSPMRSPLVLWCRPLCGEYLEACTLLGARAHRRRTIAFGRACWVCHACCTHMCARTHRSSFGRTTHDGNRCTCITYVHYRPTLRALMHLPLLGLRVHRCVCPCGCAGSLCTQSGTYVQQRVHTDARVGFYIPRWCVGVCTHTPGSSMPTVAVWVCASAHQAHL